MGWYISTANGKRNWSTPCVSTENANSILRWLNHNHFVMVLRWQRNRSKDDWGRVRWEKYVRGYCITPWEFIKATLAWKIVIPICDKWHLFVVKLLNLSHQQRRR